MDCTGIPPMSCTPARPRWNTPGIFVGHLTCKQERASRPLVVGVAGTPHAVGNPLGEAPMDVRDAMSVRQTMRRVRRSCIIVASLTTILPLTDVLVEDVKALTHPGPVQVGSDHPSRRLRERCGLEPTQSKTTARNSSQCIDSRLWYLLPVVLRWRLVQRRRLIQEIQVKDCRSLTRVVWRSWLVSAQRDETARRWRPSLPRHHQARKMCSSPVTHAGGSQRRVSLKGV